jgi:hypothetical protein
MTVATTAGRYATALLGGPGPDCAGAPSPSIDWARSGAMALSGRREGPALLAPGPLASCARAAVAAAAALSPGSALAELDGPALLGERAALLGLERSGATSPGGSCRLLRAADGWIALNLPRPDDVALLPAWIGCNATRDPWPPLRGLVRRRRADDLVERARLLGLAAAVAAPPPDEPPPWRRVTARGRPAPPRHGPLVIDLSSLWAGPLCTQLLLLAGARVVKLESTKRPDGARQGPARFFDLMNAGKESVALDLTSPEGVRALRALLARADIVVESSRPRALAQLGVRAEALVEGRPGLTWLSLTGYGRASPGCHWAAFGDDAAVAAGVTAGDEEGPVFCGDAVADPLTGLHAAVAVLRSWREGGGQLLDLALRDVAAYALAFESPEPVGSVHRDGGGWCVSAGGESQPVLDPRARTPQQSARPLGSDTLDVLRELSGC